MRCCFKFNTKFTIKLLIFLFINVATSANTPCQLKETSNGAVCVCSADYCDYLENPIIATENEFVVVSTSQRGLRFEPIAGKFGAAEKLIIKDYKVTEHDDSNSRKTHLKIKRDKQYQKIVGFGGSITGAVSHMLNQFPQKLQDHIYSSYYAPNGLGFNLLRITIGGCDFDLAPWAYNETPIDDINLTNFTKLDYREALRAKQIKRLKKVTKIKNLRIKGAAWSPPRWMKSNNKWSGISHLKREYYQTWTDYHLKWIDLMHKEGLPIWAISTGNEPLNGLFFAVFVKFMSLGWTPMAQAIWLADSLGPTLKNSTYKDVIIFSNDDQRYSYTVWFHLMKLTRPKSLDYVDGFAVHWYFDEIIRPSILDNARQLLPNRLLLSSESCIGDKPWHKNAPLLGSWTRGVKYARAFIEDLLYGFHGWIDWNIMLDETGGPTYINNTVDAPIVANMTNKQEFYKQPIFYNIGHFTKFIPEGSVRIDVVKSNINVHTVGFLTPQGDISVVMLNSGRASVDVTIEDTVRGKVVINIPANSIHTLIYR